MGYIRQKPRSTYCVFRDSEKVRAAIELRLKESKLTVAEISRRTGIPEKGINTWRKRSRRVITQSQLIQLADYLGVHLDITVGFTDPKY